MLSQASGSLGHSKHRKACGKMRGNMRACAEWLRRNAPQKRRPQMFGSMAELMRALRR